jgi:hypothetical protein
VKYLTRTTALYNRAHSDDEALENFVVRIEDIAMTEVTEWRGEFTRNADTSQVGPGRETLHIDGAQAAGH